jgi:hypothetical protein
MKVGLFGARADDRGLGRLTHDFYTHMRPDRTLAVDMGVHARQFVQHLGRYPDATVAPFNGGTFDEATMRRFFAGLDVAVMYETAYDHRAYDIARAAGCRTVLMVMPEFARHLTEPHLPHPDVVWAPTTWRLDMLPASTRVVPVPVAAELAPTSRPGRSLRILHVAGHRATGDRNGTLIFLRSLRALRSSVAVRIATQDRRLPNVRGLPRSVSVNLGGTADYWALYRDADLLVMPRRYGGLCLPVQEALAAGLGVVMTDCEPNPATWPISPIGSRPGTTIRTPGGPLTLNDPDPADLAATIDRLAANPDEVADLQARAQVWATTNSWERLAPLYLAELERAAAPAVTAA